MILEGGFIGERGCLDGGDVVDHCVQEECPVGSVADLDGLVDGVFDGPGRQCHTAVDREVDWDGDEDVGDVFLP